MTRPFRIFATCCMAIGLGATLVACDNTKRNLGLVPTAPDEFAVVHRAPLSMPPDFTLRPPRPGAPSPQDEATAAEAQDAVLGRHGEDGSGLSPGGAAILNATGAGQANPDIRQQVDAESAHTPPAQRPVAQRLVGWTGLTGDKNTLPPAQVVDPQAEAARLQKAQAAGQSPTAGGPTPSVEN